MTQQVPASYAGMADLEKSIEATGELLLQLVQTLRCNAASVAAGATALETERLRLESERQDFQKEMARVVETSNMQKMLQNFEVNMANKLQQQTDLLLGSITASEGLGSRKEQVPTPARCSRPFGTEDDAMLSEATTAPAPPDVVPSSMRRSGPTKSASPERSASKVPPPQPTKPPPVVMLESNSVLLPPTESLPPTVPKPPPVELAPKHRSYEASSKQSPETVVKEHSATTPHAANAKPVCKAPPPSVLSGLVPPPQKASHAASDEAFDGAAVESFPKPPPPMPQPSSPKPPPPEVQECFPKPPPLGIDNSPKPPPPGIEGAPKAPPVGICESTAEQQLFYKAAPPGVQSSMRAADAGNALYKAPPVELRQESDATPSTSPSQAEGGAVFKAPPPDVCKESVATYKAPPAEFR